MRPNEDSSKRSMHSIGSLISELISRRGYAQIAATDQIHNLIAEVVGDSIANGLTIGKLNRGVLRVYAQDSVTIQELTFQKRNILKRIEKDLPDSKVKDIRFAVLTNTS